MSRKIYSTIWFTEYVSLTYPRELAVADTIILDAEIRLYRKPIFPWLGEAPRLYKLIKTPICCVWRNGRWYIQDYMLLTRGRFGKFDFELCSFRHMLPIKDIEWHYREKYIPNLTSGFDSLIDFEEYVDASMQQARIDLDPLQINPIFKTTSKKRASELARCPYSIVGPTSF